MQSVKTTPKLRNPPSRLLTLVVPHRPDLDLGANDMVAMIVPFVSMLPTTLDQKVPEKVT